MSREVLEIVKGMNPHCLEWQLSMQCAPLITGCKISNLLMLPIRCLPDAVRLLRESELSWFILWSNPKKVSMLVYQKEHLMQYLQTAEIREILMAEGYPSDLSDLNAILKRMSERYKKTRKGMGDFPHEMGVFLGYPADDVREFIDKQGKDFLYSGYWKVYSRVEEKKQIFAQYEDARDTLIRLLNRGESLTDIMRRYHPARMAS